LKDDERIKANEVWSIGDVDMIVPNCSFEIQRKGIRYRQAPHKVRLVVERVDVEGGEAGAGPVDFVPGKSQVKFVGGDELEQVKRELAPAKPIQIEGEGIGGLDDQINVINEQLRLLTQPPFPRGHRLDRPSSVLVHGPEGTGKSLLLERLARAPWQQVIRLDRKWISTYSKVASKVVTEVFQKAQASQPSLILIDRLDKLLGKAETLCDDLADEILGLKGSRVFVAAATRSIYDIDASLRESVAFRHSVEIFPPNLRQREDILRQVMGTVGDSTTIQYESIAERTHGFVGRDLEKLCVLARDHCVSRAQALTNSPAPSDDPSAVVAEEITQDDFDAVIDKVHASIMKEVVLEVPKVQWDDIGGLEDVRQLMHSVTVRPFKVCLVSKTRRDYFI
jgi:AAA family ATPase